MNQETIPMSIHSITLDPMKHVLSFCNKKDIAIFSTTSKQFHIITSKFYLDSVHNIAYYNNQDDSYHIKHITSINKDSIKQDLINMTYGNNLNKYLLTPQKYQDFDWAMFIAKQLRGYALSDTCGYWEILKKDHPNYVSIDDLNKIKSLSIHKQTAPKLLNSNDNPKSKITICIHDNTVDDKVRMYDILFWNGSDIYNTSCFQICKSGKTNYYIHFKSDLPNIGWCWYDNNSALGFDVEKQIECSFQANLTHNFPIPLPKQNTNDFPVPCVNNVLKKLITQIKRKDNKLTKVMFVCHHDLDKKLVKEAWRYGWVIERKSMNEMVIYKSNIYMEIEASIGTDLCVQTKNKSLLTNSSFDMPSIETLSGDKISDDEIFAVQTTIDHETIQVDLKQQKMPHLKCQLSNIIRKYKIEVQENMEFYIPINKQESKLDYIYGPCVCTTLLEVGEYMAGDEGRIITITPELITKNNFALFDASLISEYPYQQEYLIDLLSIKM